MRDLAMQRGIMWQLWMWIYRIRRVCCPRCIELLLKSRTTVWRQSGLHGQGSQKSVPFYPIVFINLSIFEWVGFRTKWMEFENVERSAGETKWSLRKLFFYSLEGITGFSVAPLSLASVVGILFCILSFLIIVFIIVRTIVWGDPVAGWPSLVCIIFMVSGVQLLCTGIVGQYLSKTYLETKHRPIYILKDSSEENQYEQAEV